MSDCQYKGCIGGLVAECLWILVEWEIKQGHGSDNEGSLELDGENLKADRWLFGLLLCQLFMKFFLLIKFDGPHGHLFLVGIFMTGYCILL